MQLKVTADKKFLRKSPSDKVTIGNAITGKIEELPPGPPFTAWPVPVATLAAVTTTLQHAAAAAKSGDHNAIDQRNAAEKAWDAAFSSTADYVSVVAAGSEAVISSTGFTPTKSETHERVKPMQPEGADAGPSGHGGAQVGCDADTNVEAFLYIAVPEGTDISWGPDGQATITVAGGARIYVKADTHSKTVLSNLTRSLPLSISITPINNKGAGEAATGMTVTPQ